MRSRRPAVPEPRALPLVVGAVASGLTAAMAFATGGPLAGLGFGLGVVGTGGSLAGTWLAVQWVGRILRDESPPWQGAVAPVAVLVFKLPVVLGAMALALHLGPPAPAWFLGGLALVYSATIWWAVSRH